MELFYIILITFFGLAWGSFLSVVIWRVDDARSIIFGRSKCTHCKQTLKWYDLVPLISYGLLCGRCRKCGEKISLLYPLIEIITGTIVLLLYFYVGLGWVAVVAWLIFSVLIVTLGYDAIHMLIIDQVVWLGVALVIVFHLISKSTDVSWLSVLPDFGIGLAIGLGVPLALMLMGRGRWMGEGDVMVGALIGLFLGYPNIIVAYVLAFILGSLYGVGLIIFSQKKLKDAVAFGPFLVIGTIAAFFFGAKLIGWYLGI